MSDTIVYNINRPTRTIELPCHPGSRVEIFPSLLARDLLGIDKTDDLTIGLTTAHKYIKSWNFTDDAGQPLPITSEAILNLDSRDVTFLLQEIGRFMTDEKKS